jgi:MFS family permease
MTLGAPNNELRSHWRLLVACVVGVSYGMSAMGLTYTLGAFVGPLSSEFGWSRQEILSVTVFATLGVIPASLAGGWIVDRYGARRFTLLSQLGLGFVFIALGLCVDSLATLYALYFLLPLVSIGTTPITFGSVIAGTFDRQRGFALGLALAGTGLCAITVPPFAAWVIGEWGWRAGYVAIGLLPLAIALPFTWAWVHDHRGRGATGSALRLPGVEAADAFRGWRFWAMMLAFFIVSGAATGLLTNAVPLLTSRGYTPLAAGSALSLFGIAVVVGRLLVGWLVDRFWAPLVGVAFLGPAGLAVVSMIPGEVSWAATLVALCVAGLATGAEFDLCAYLVVRYFGLRAYGRIYGALFIAFAAGAGVVGPLFGALYDRFARYDEILAIIGAGYVTCAVVLLALGRYPAVFNGAASASHPDNAAQIARTP